MAKQKSPWSAVVPCPNCKEPISLRGTMTVELHPKARGRRVVTKVVGYPGAVYAEHTCDENNDDITATP